MCESSFHKTCLESHQIKPSDKAFNLRQAKHSRASKLPKERRTLPARLQQAQQRYGSCPPRGNLAILAGSRDPGLVSLTSLSYLPCFSLFDLFVLLAMEAIKAIPLGRTHMFKGPLALSKRASAAELDQMDMLGHAGPQLFSVVSTVFSSPGDGHAVHAIPSPPRR